MLIEQKDIDAPIASDKRIDKLLENLTADADPKIVTRLLLNKVDELLEKIPFNFESDPITDYLHALLEKIDSARWRSHFSGQAVLPSKNETQPVISASLKDLCCYSEDCSKSYRAINEVATWLTQTIPEEMIVSVMANYVHEWLLANWADEEWEVFSEAIAFIGFEFDRRPTPLGDDLNRDGRIEKAYNKRYG